MSSLLSNRVPEGNSMVNQDLNRQVELNLITQLLQFMQSKGRTFAIKEMPITSVSLSKEQSVPDALLDDGTWVENYNVFKNSGYV